MGAGQEVDKAVTGKKRIFILSQWMRIDGVASSLVSRLKELDYSKVEVDLCLKSQTGPWMAEIPNEVRLLPEMKVRRRCERLVRFLWYWTAGIYYRVFRGCHIDPVGGAQIAYELEALFGWYPEKLGEWTYDECWIYGGNPGFAKRVDAKVKKAWVHEDWGVWKPVKWLARRQFRGLDEVVNVSDEARAHFDALKLTDGRSVTIENTLSVRWLRERADAYEVAEFRGLKLLSVGRTTAAKNFRRAIETAEVLKGRGVKFRWVVIGDGEEYTGLKGLAKERGVDDVIEFAGGMANPCPYYKWCDVYVCTSDTEAKSVTICEAQAMGKPVIMTAFPTAKAHIQDKERDLIAGMEADSLAEAILKITSGGHWILYNCQVLNGRGCQLQV